MINSLCLIHVQHNFHSLLWSSCAWKWPVVLSLLSDIITIGFTTRLKQIVLNNTQCIPFHVCQVPGTCTWTVYSLTIRFGNSITLVFWHNLEIFNYISQYFVSKIIKCNPHPYTAIKLLSKHKLYNFVFVLLINSFYTIRWTIEIMAAFSTALTWLFSIYPSLLHVSMYVVHTDSAD